MEKIIPLTELPLHTPAIIHNYEEPGKYAPLMEMGCVPGETISIERIAPLGDPILVNIDGYQLSMRKKEATCIMVKLNDRNI